jgi:mono/diheme cytochrome c family protein
MVIAAVDAEVSKNSSTDPKLSIIRPVYPYEITGARNCGINVNQFSVAGITEAVSWNAKARLAECTVKVETDWKGEPMSLMTVQALRSTMLAPVLAAAAWNANAQDGDVAAGRVFAREACIACHVVDPANASPRVVAIGPNFQDIGNTKGMTATALRVFLTTSHPKMPNLIITPEDTTDVIAYILSLREHQ